VFGAVVAGLLLVDEPLAARNIIGATFSVFGAALIIDLDALTNFSIQN
jgi:drug/metabolite transporter (DMT)-like permease